MHNIITEQDLYHHGVKGMKWGVRKDQNTNPKYYDKHAYVSDTLNKKGERKVNREIKKANRNPELKDKYTSITKELDSIADRNFKGSYNTAQSKINKIHNKNILDDYDTAYKKYSKDFREDFIEDVMGWDVMQLEENYPFEIKTSKDADKAEETFRAVYDFCKDEEYSNYYNAHRMDIEIGRKLLRGK